MTIYELLRTSRSTDKATLQKEYLNLLESYQLVADFAESPEVAAIAQGKLEKMRALGCAAGLSDAAKPEEQTEEISLTSIRLALNSSRSNEIQLRKIDLKLLDLPDSAEKFYLKAVTRLKRDSSLSGCTAAAQDLKRSLMYDPTSQAASALLDALDEQITAYQHTKQLEKEQADRERQEAERRQQEALAQARRDEFAHDAGNAAMGCCCACGECCDACGSCDC